MDQIRLNALAIIQKNGLLLAARGIEFGELASDALKREFREELNATIVREKFLRIIENIFEFNSEKKHEITFLFDADVEENHLYQNERIEILDKKDYYAEWIPIQEIKNGNTIVYPKEAVDFL